MVVPVVCLYLTSFTSCKASKMTILKILLQEFNIFGSMADSPGGDYHPVPYMFRKFFSCTTFAS